MSKYNTIGDYAEAFSGFAFSSGDLVDNGVPVIKIGNIQNGVVLQECDSFYQKEITEKLKRYILNSNDFLIAMTGAGSVGRAGKMRSFTETVYLVNQRVAIVRTRDNANPDYLFYYFSMPYVERYLYSLGIGAGQPNISAKDIMKIKVTFPDKIIQNKIADILVTYDELIELNTKRIKTLEQMAENLYKEWFVRFRFPGHEKAEFENGIPKWWEKVRAEKAITFNPTIKTNDQTSFTIIPMEALSTTSMILDSNSFTTEDSITGKRSQNGDTLLAKITPCLENGKTGFVMGLPEGEVFGGSTEFVVMRSKTLSPYYVYFLARSHYFRQTAILSMNGADGRQRVSEDKLKSTTIVQPPKNILDKFDGIVSKMFTTIQTIVDQNDNLIKQRDLLLPRLMSGKLEV